MIDESDVNVTFDKIDSNSKNNTIPHQPIAIGHPEIGQIPSKIPIPFEETSETTDASLSNENQYYIGYLKYKAKYLHLKEQMQNLK